MPVNLSHTAAPVCVNDPSSASQAAGNWPAAPQFSSSLVHNRPPHYQHLLELHTCSRGFTAGTALRGGAPLRRRTLPSLVHGFVRRSLVFFFFLTSVLLSTGHFTRPACMQDDVRQMCLAFREAVLIFFSSFFMSVVSNQSGYSDLRPL